MKHSFGKNKCGSTSSMMSFSKNREIIKFLSREIYFVFFLILKKQLSQIVSVFKFLNFDITLKTQHSHSFEEIIIIDANVSVVSAND